MPQRTAAAIHQTMNITQILSALDNQRPLPRPSATESNTATSQALSNMQSEPRNTEQERKVREAPNSSANAFTAGQDFEMTEEEEAAATLLEMKNAIWPPSPSESLVSSSTLSSESAEIEEAAMALLSMKSSTSSSRTSSSLVDSRVTSSSNKPSARGPRESSARISKPSSNPNSRRKVAGGRELNGLKDFLPLPENSGLGSKQARKERRTWNSRSTFGV